MKIVIKPGKYIVAVSGGVDSIVLLDLLSKNKDLELVVAHFDHGIRRESEKDKNFVVELAGRYGLPIRIGEGRLGSGTSEERARRTRYDFLHEVMKSEGADAIITAHHQDDLVETVIFNILRGTGRKGITSLSNNKNIQRPLLGISKNEIIKYAKTNNLAWVVDSTNYDTQYTRNWIRHILIPKMDDEKKDQILMLYQSHQPINSEVDEAIKRIIDFEQDLKKSTLLNLPYSISCELVAGWLRDKGLAEFDKKTIDRIVRGVKTLPTGKTIDIYDNNQVIIGDKKLEIVKR